MSTPPSPGFSPMEVEAARFLGRWQLLGVGNLRVLAVLCQSEGVIFYSLLVRIVGKSISFMLRRCTAETVACKFGPLSHMDPYQQGISIAFLFETSLCPPRPQQGFLMFLPSNLGRSNRSWHRTHIGPFQNLTP